MLLPPEKNKLIHKYKTEGVAQLKNIQKLGNNHVNFEKNVFFSFCWLFYKRKILKHFFPFKNICTSLYKNTKLIQIC